jgi:predicted transport protein
VALERSLQTLIEANMETLFGVRLLASEYSTGIRHGGRMDSLGIDENGSPVIFEYKRAVNESVINQGLFYLDWLMDHRGDFKVLVLDRLGAEAAEAIDWRNPRLICVASGFTKYDEHAVNQMNRSIDLVRYRDFEGELLALELIHSSRVDSVTSVDAPDVAPGGGTSPAPATYKTVTEYLEQSPPELKDWFGELDDYVRALGDDVTQKTLKYYIAYRRLRNFLCVEVLPARRQLTLYLKVNPDTVDLIEGFTRDVRQIGHFGTGDLEVRVTGPDSLAQALPLVQRSYEES